MNNELFRKLKLFWNQRLSLITKFGRTLSLDNGVCFTVSKITVEMFKEAGYNCELQRVDVLIANNKWFEAFKRGLIGKISLDELTSTGAWAIGTRKDTFHYVIYFPDTDEVMDLTFGQFNRPQHKIHALPYWTKRNKLPHTIADMRFIPYQEPTETAVYYENPQWTEETRKLGIDLIKGKN